MLNPKEILEKARQLNNKSRFNDVVVFLKDEKIAALNNAEIYAELAMAYWRLAEVDKCNTQCDEALKADPLNYKANHYKGNVYCTQKEFEKAIDCYNLSIKINPANPFPHNGLGNVYLSLDDFTQALHHFNSAISVKKNFQFSYNGLGNAYAKLKRYEDAIGCYEMAIKLNKKDAYPLNGLGTVYLENKNYIKAVEIYEKAIATDKRYADSYFNRGIAYLKCKDYNKSLSDFEAYLGLSKDPPNFLQLFATSKIETLKKMIGDPEYYGKLTEISEEIKDMLLYEGDNVTHYTSLSVTSLLILNRDSRFRLSEGTFLNDTSEGRELFDFLPPISNIIKNTGETIAKNFVPKPFIGSFVTEEQHDDLTLWRMYGKENKEEARGCAITLDRERLLGNLIKMLNPQDINRSHGKKLPAKIHEEFSFYRVAYKNRHSEKNQFIIPGSPETIEEKLNNAMGQLKEIVIKYLGRQHENDSKDLFEILNQISYLFKSSQYQDENELRLIVNGYPLMKKIDTTMSPPRVFIELVNINSLIKKITLGPKVQCAEEMASVFYYKLDEIKNYPDILISKLPFK